MFLKKAMMKSTGSYWDNIELLKHKINTADAVIIGAGAGLSTASGFTYSGERFTKYFIFLISLRNIILGICTPADFTRLKRLRNTGRTGLDISI